MPIFRSRHSSASAPPVVSAMRGMWPSVWSRGSRVTFASVRGLSWQAMTFGDCHLPAPLADLDHERHVGADGNVAAHRAELEAAAASVPALTTGSPEVRSLQLSQLGPSV